jgi:hypothetical protein
MSEPWGYKVTAVVYVEGPMDRAEFLAENFHPPADGEFPGLDFCGVRIEAVQDEPKDQVAS